jgi:hypothetical protein
MLCTGKKGTLSPQSHIPSLHASRRRQLMHSAQDDPPACGADGIQSTLSDLPGASLQRHLPMASADGGTGSGENAQDENPERQLGALEAGQNLGGAASNPGPAAGGAAGRAQSCSFCAPRPGARDTSAGEGNKITADEAITIFLARSPRDRKFKHSSISNELAEAFGISQKAVRDIWNLRTWWEVTRPFWSAQDYQRFHAKYGATRMCAACRQAGHAIAWQGVMSQPGQSQSAAGGSAVGSAANQQGLTGHFMAGQMPVSTATRHDVLASVLQPAFSWPPASSAHQHAGQVPANPGSSWSGPITQPVAETAHSLRYVAPAVSAASRSQGAASASIETGSQAGQVGLATGRPRGDDAAVGTFIDGWAIPRIQWLTPPDVELFDYGDARAEAAATQSDGIGHRLSSSWPRQGR